MFLGRINAVKNLPLAVDAVEYLRSKGHHVVLDIYGRDDGMLQSVLQYIKNKNLEEVIRFAGEVNAAQKQKAFGEHHFLIQLSANEGMAMSVAEAMQNGLVCFVTPVGEIPNYATDMKTAIFADISTPETFRESLEKLETVLRDANIYNAISGDSYASFRNVNTYSESLVQQIHEALI
jgi:glycosyltransferase involved in cell wall biosynthesis